MKITIFGCTGAVGGHLVDQAVSRGWEVVAFARSPEKLGDYGEQVEIIEGNVRDADAVRWAVREADGLVSAVGHTERSQGDVLEVAARNYVAAMRDHAVSRLVTLVGAGVEMGGDASSIGRWVMRSVMKLMVGEMLADAQQHSDIIAETDLDWTIVRPPRLTDGERTGQTRAGYLSLGPTATISRADLAEFMLDQMVSEEWVRKAPMVVGD